MTTQGWAFMVLSNIFVLGLSGWCLYRVLTLPPKEVTEHLKGPAEIDTGDTRDAD